MTLRANWKMWSMPVCLAASLSLQPAFGQDFYPLTADSGFVESAMDDEFEQDDAEFYEETDVLEPIAEEASEDWTEEEAAPVPEARDVSPLIKAQPVETPEVIEERYPNGKIKVAREVVQDAHGNYLNHGAWKMFNERTALVMEGQFYEDQRHGIWNRWYAAGEVAFLKERPFTEFSAPFISQAIFNNGELHGGWIVYDAKHRKVCEIRFDHGERDGLATWYHPNGRKMREMRYDKGVMHGDVTEWQADGSVARQNYYDQGRKLSTQTTYHTGTVKKSSGQYLEPELQTKTLDDWAKGEMATYVSQGKPIKHGAFQAWHTNGQLKMQGEYKYDLPVGTFTWWYPNGQKSLEGSFDEGKQEGEWAWWHENGQRSIRGYYESGNPTGKWTWWNKEGKVAQSGDFSEDTGSIVVAPQVPPAEQAEVPTPATRPQKR